VVGLGLQGRFDGFLECRPAGQAVRPVETVKAKSDKWIHDFIASIMQSVSFLLISA
jgi:hypothetical protein